MNQALLTHMKKPIVFFDLETTGLDFMQDRIVSFSFQKIYPDGTMEEYSELINPGIPIPPELTAIHGISDADVHNAPTFKQVALALLAVIDGCDLAGYNIMIFDLPLLTEELGRVNIDLDLSKTRIIDVCTIYKKLRPRTLSAAFRYYIGYDREGAHEAQADTLATIDVMGAIIEKDGNVIGTDPDAWEKFAIDRSTMVDLAGKLVWSHDGHMIFNFGPQKGNKVSDNMGMLKWMIGKNFSRDTMRWVYLIQDNPQEAYRIVPVQSDPDPLPFGENPE